MNQRQRLKFSSEVYLVLSSGLRSVVRFPNFQLRETPF